MLRIRLQRVGRKHEPSFRVVLTESQNAAKSGRVQEVLGSYDPRFDKPVIKGDRVKHWISMGAQPTDTVHNLLINQKIIEGKKKNVLPKKSPPKAEVAEEAKPAPAEASEKAPEAAAEAPKEDLPDSKDVQAGSKAEEAPKEEVAAA